MSPFDWRQFLLNSSAMHMSPSAYGVLQPQFVDEFRPLTLKTCSPIEARLSPMRSANAITPTWRIHGKIGKKTAEVTALTALLPSLIKAIAITIRLRRQTMTKTMMTVTTIRNIKK